MRPDALKFNSDVKDALFIIGINEGKWGIENNSDERLTWPFVLIWVSADKRNNAPEKFYFQFELDNYPAQAPNICIWNPILDAPLEQAKRPKGIGDSYFMFRADWENGNHIYTPYERRTISAHAQEWLNGYPNLRWKNTDSIFKILEHLHFTLNNPDYHGV